MSDPAIRAVGLGKQFDLGERAVYRTLRDSIANAFTAPFRRVRGNSNGYPERSNPSGGRSSFWALKDISFEVKQGEVLGIIGANGAGKSTLLKILTRITTPTEGYAEVRGRVGALLEVGTGFNPELTGRENVYVNGSILGLTRREITRKFDSIIDFAGVETFVDTPVKRYSSGMQVRLAFAVAAHLEPEIMIIDEVLAVGDAEFQKKCLGAMKNMGGKGRTVLFVSHNLAAISMLCARVLVIDQGRIVTDTNPNDAISSYLSRGETSYGSAMWDAQEPPGDAYLHLIAAATQDDSGQPAKSFRVTDPVWIALEYEIKQDLLDLIIQLQFMNNYGITVFSTVENDPQWAATVRPSGRYRSKVSIPPNLLTQGELRVSCIIKTRKSRTKHVDIDNLLTFVVDEHYVPESARGNFSGNLPGVVRPHLSWNTEVLQDHRLN